MDQEQAKIQYKNIYSVQLDDELDILFRPLTISEYETLKNVYPSFVDLEEQIVLKTALNIENLDNIPAGYISVLAEEIVECSYLSDASSLRKLIKSKRENVNEYINQILVTIITAMPAYTVEALKLKTVEDLIDLVVLSEKVLENKQFINGIPEAQLRSFETDPFTYEEMEEMYKAQETEYNKKRKPGQPTLGDPIAEKLLGM